MKRIHVENIDVASNGYAGGWDVNICFAPEEGDAIETTTERHRHYFHAKVWSGIMEGLAAFETNHTIITS